LKPNNSMRTMNKYISLGLILIGVCTVIAVWGIVKGSVLFFGIGILGLLNLLISMARVREWMNILKG